MLKLHIYTQKRLNCIIVTRNLITCLRTSHQLFPSTYLNCLNFNTDQRLNGSSYLPVLLDYMIKGSHELCADNKYGKIFSSIFHDIFVEIIFVWCI